MLTERCLKIRLSGSWKEMAVLCGNQRSSVGCIRALTPHIEHESPDMLQFDIDTLVGQSECAAQSGKAQGLSSDDMLCDPSCIVKPDSITISDASRAETGLTGHINNAAMRAHSADCVIRLVTLNL